MKPPHRTPRKENPGDGGRGAMRRAHQPAAMEMTKAQLATRLAELEAALRPFARLKINVSLDGTHTTVRVLVSDVMAAQAALETRK